MPHPRLAVRDALGERDVTLDHFPFTIGRREANDLQLGGSEVSREHAQIRSEGGQFLLRDCESRYGTFVNGDPVTECALQSGDKIRLGRGGGADLTFLADDDSGRQNGRSTTGARDDLRQLASLLAGVRALGSGRVLQDIAGGRYDAPGALASAKRLSRQVLGAQLEGVPLKTRQILIDLQRL